MALEFGGTSTGMMSKEFRQGCKFVLGIGRSTSSAAALGECGKLPIAAHYHKGVIKYWLNLIKHHHDSLIYNCYWLQLSMDKQNRSCWFFGYAWTHQEVGNEVEFLKSFVQRISDICRQVFLRY